jgi:RNA polymerase sigma-70 factor (ECF subfamily)
MTMDEIELGLARRAASGDTGAFEAIMRTHNRMLYRTARAILRDDAEAEDCLQSAYLLAFRSMGRFEGRAKLSTWLTRIVINEAIGRSRKLARWKAAVPIGEVGDEADALPLGCHPAMPEQEAMRSEMRRSLQERIEALPQSLRQVFVLRALEEMNVAETARALGITGGAVRVRFCRARSRLRKALAGTLS